MATKTTSSSRCDACFDGIGLWQAAFTSECAHTFHLRCVSGRAACPACAAAWRHTPAAAPAPPPATPFSFTTTATGVFGQRPQAAAGSASPFSNFSGAQPPSPQPSGRSLFGQQQATPNPFWLTPAPLAAQPSPPSPCSVCGGAMGQGQATVTSECAHTFHLRCFSGSVCPVCGARWRDEVTVAPPSPLNNSSPALPPAPLFWTPKFAFEPPNPSTTRTFMTPPLPSFAPMPTWFSGSSGFSVSVPPRPWSFDLPSVLFDDDEPVEPPAHHGRDTVKEATRNGVVVLKTHCENSAVARDAAQDSFAVLVHAKAPVAAGEASARAPLDLVAVLDVSGSMEGSKLALLKQATGFVIDNLGPRDRLGVVIFSTKARRVIRLTRMSSAGKATAKGAMESLVADGCTNIGDGLGVAANVLDSRRQRNAVAGIILLSDGQDNETGCRYGPDGRQSHRDLVPHSLRRSGGSRCAAPVHTFGFGRDHDAAAMQAIAEETGGTFSFVENLAGVQDSFAQCIGGLLSVAVQEARVAVECLDTGVRVRAVKSGRYESSVGPFARAASVDVGEMYADEERRFLLFLDVPVAAEDGGVTRLIRARCTYRDAATGQSVEVSGEDAVVQRPAVVAGAAPSVEVARERFRVEAAEDLAAARAAAERGAHAEAARILDRRQEASASAGLAGDARCAALVAELRELSARVADRREYEQTGRAFMLAGITAHAQQRASTVHLTSAAAAPSPSLFGPGPTPGFGSTTSPACRAALSPSLFGPATTAGFGSPAFGAAPSCFSFGFATPAMEGMVASSRRMRESAAGTDGSDGTIGFSFS